MAKKVPISQSQQPLQINPFANLDVAGLPEGPTQTPAAPSVPPSEKKKPRIVLRREKSHRGGKTVIVVSQIPTHLSVPEIESLAKAAKQSLGCGGCVIGREIEIQGDQPDRVRAYFEGRGFQVGGV